MTKSLKVVKVAKTCHSVCSGGLDVVELCASTRIYIVEIAIFGRPVLLESDEKFDLFSDGSNTNVIESIEKLFEK